MKLHFDDCPHNCNASGKLFDRNIKTMIDCPYCKEKRKSLTKGEEDVKVRGEMVSMQEALGFSDPYLSPYYSFDALIPEEEMSMVMKESLIGVSDSIDELRGKLALGELPERSYCFGLARKGFVEKLAYPLLAKAYEMGIQSCKYVSSREYYARYIQDKPTLEYLDTEFLVVVVNSGSKYQELMLVRGLMESRATKGKATVFVTNCDIDECSLLLGYIGNASKYYASPYFVERNKTVDNHSYYSDKIRGGLPTRIDTLGISMEDLKDL